MSLMDQIVFSALILYLSIICIWIDCQAAKDIEELRKRIETLEEKSK